MYISLLKLHQEYNLKAVPHLLDFIISPRSLWPQGHSLSPSVPGSSHTGLLFIPEIPQTHSHLPVIVPTISSASHTSLPDLPRPAYFFPSNQVSVQTSPLQIDLCAYYCNLSPLTSPHTVPISLLACCIYCHMISYLFTCLLSDSPIGIEVPYCYLYCYSPNTFSTVNTQQILA